MSVKFNTKEPIVIARQLPPPLPNPKKPNRFTAFMEAWVDCVIDGQRMNRMAPFEYCTMYGVSKKVPGETHEVFMNRCISDVVRFKELSKALDRL